MIFRIKKLYVCVSWYFFIIFFGVLLTNKLKTFLFCFLALTIHELGHIITIYKLNEKINIFYILPFGFCCRVKNQSKINKNNMLKILFAGPVASILAAGFFCLWTKEFAISNFIVGLFNLIPIGDLDGGRIIRLLPYKE